MPPRSSSRPGCAKRVPMTGRWARRAPRRHRHRGRAGLVRRSGRRHLQLLVRPADLVRGARLERRRRPLLGAIYQPTTDELWCGGRAPRPSQRLPRAAAARPTRWRSCRSRPTCIRQRCRMRAPRAAAARDGRRGDRPDARLGSVELAAVAAAASAVAADRVAAVGLAARRGTRPRPRRRDRGLRGGWPPWHAARPARLPSARLSRSSAAEGGTPPPVFPSPFPASRLALRRAQGCG